MKINQLRLKDRNKLYIADINIIQNEEEILDSVAKELEDGAQIVLYKINCLNAKQSIKAGKKIRELCSIFNALFIVSNRLDIAQIIEADGVHLEEDDIDINMTKDYMPDTMIIGCTVKTTQQALKAADEGYDYLLIDFDEEKQHKLNIPCFKFKKMLDSNLCFR